MALRRLFLFGPFVLSLVVACGELLGGDEETAPPPRPGVDAAVASDATLPDGAVENDAGIEGGPACSANGTLDFDPTFGTPTFPLDQAKSALSSAGVIGTVGRCRDGGEGLELAHVSLDGSVTPATSCFSSSSLEVVESIAPTAQGWLVGSSRNTGPFNARAVHLSDTGVELAEEDLPPITSYANSYSKFALPVGGKIVYGGYRVSGSTLPEHGFLKVLGAINAMDLGAYSAAVAAAVSADRLYVAITLGAQDVTTKQLFIKRYEVVNDALVEDPLSTGTPPVVTALPLSFDGLGSILVEGDVVSIAVGDGATTRILKLANGAWTQESLSAFAPVRLARSCDGALIVSGPFDLGGADSEQALVRRIDGGPAGQLKMPNTSANIVSLLRHPGGDLYVLQNPGSMAIARRVVP